MKRTILGAAIAALIATATLAAPRANAGDNVVVATSKHDGGTVFRVSLAIRRNATGVVDDANVAVAAASDCSGCKTVAISLQAVLATRDANVWTPTNMALAINIDCPDCETLAEAYQWAFETGGPVHFTAEGNRRLAQLRHELQELRRSDLSVWALLPQAQAIADEFADILSTELVRAGKQ